MRFILLITLLLSLKGAYAMRIETPVKASAFQNTTLTQLQGKWKRVSCDFPNVNGLLIEISGDSGLLRNAAGASYSKDVELIKDITEMPTGDLSLLYLGTDGQYYPSTIRLNGEEFWMTIGPEGAGNIQRWEKASDSNKSLDGGWVRIDGNNSRANGMIIQVTGNSAVIMDPADTRLKSGDLKWRQIKGTQDGNYTHEELGSDYNYYNGSIRNGQDDTLMVSVGFGGEGNVQKWVRTKAPNNQFENPSSDTSDLAQILDCNKEIPSKLTNGPGPIDYIVEHGCVIDVTTPLTVEAGTVVVFRENAGLGFYDKGSIMAVGQSGNPIIFKGEQDLPEYWRGIHLESISSNNRLENVTIANAGNTYVYCCNPKASLFINQGLISLKNVTIEKGGAYGLYAKEGSGFSDFQNVQIRSHKGYPLVIESAALGSLGTGNDFSGNDQDYIYILPEALTYSLLWPRQEIPYYIPEILDITADLTLEAGTTFFFGDKAGLGIYGQGSLSAIGTSSDPIEFKGILNSRGSWRGIHIETKNPKNRLEYVKIANAGSDFVYCCNEKASLFLKGANIGLSNLTLSKGGGTGIYIGEESLLSTYRDIKITSHDGSPLLMDAETVRFLDSNSDYSGNTDSFIHIFGDVKKNTTWSLQNIPYRIEQGVMDVTSSLIIEAGVIVEMGQNSGIGVYDQGSITADGKLESPIVFKGLNDIPGYWRGFHIETNSTANLFSHVELKNAGSNYVYCCNEKAGIILKGSGRLAMQHTNIHRNNGCGIFAHSQAQLRMGEGNTLSDNSSGNVCR